MPRIIRTRQANEDALSIWAYIAEHDPNAADQLILRINEMLQKLVVHPGLGSKHDKFRKGLRCFPIGNYLIFYEPIENGIQILRILHGARQWEDLL
ncbi:Toxin ParE3 [Gimesia alba]|uniref:Toxin ParE3 n=1 Tax=Gimesia alba TaxID=2527973 RepID=A0A517RKZ2_9PLAN|nr:type II toxin-antitoxin system RelE/ParE family toxin [Gimesia alba]QDT44528.1 Toxin ParE3 [Gimesia alba]